MAGFGKIKVGFTAEGFNVEAYKEWGRQVDSMRAHLDNMEETYRGPNTPFIVIDLAALSDYRARLDKVAMRMIEGMERVLSVVRVGDDSEGEGGEDENCHVE